MGTDARINLLKKELFDLRLEEAMAKRNTELKKDIGKGIEEKRQEIKDMMFKHELEERRR